MRSNRWITAVMIGLISLLGLGTANAQDETNDNAYTLQECVDYALANHQNIKNAQLEFEKSELKVKETVSMGLPQIDGKIDFMYNGVVQSQFVPANAFDPAAPDDAVSPLAFGVDYSSSASLTLTQLVFDGSYFVGLRASRTYKDLFQKSVDQSKIEVVENVKKAYYGALVADDRLALLEKNKSQLDQLQKETKLMLDNGLADKLSYQRIQVSINALDVQIAKVRNGASLSLDLLKFQMGMDPNESIKLEQSFDDVIGGLAFEEFTGDSDVGVRVEHQLLNIQVGLNELALENEKVRAYPSVGAFASLGANYGALSFGDVFGLGDWKPYNVMGLQVDVPIFSSGRRKHRVGQAAIELEKSQNELEQVDNSLKLQFIQGRSNYNEAVSSIDIQKSNMELAQEVYEGEQKKYKAGVGSNFAVVQAETALQEAQTNYYGAVYDALIALVDLDKAQGKLNNN